jgi:hypothetical protein
VLLKIGPPVETDRTFDVSLVIRGGVYVDFEYADVRVLGVLREPVGLDEHVFGIASHGWFSKMKIASGKVPERRRRRDANAPLQAA